MTEMAGRQQFREIIDAALHLPDQFIKGSQIAVRITAREIVQVTIGGPRQQTVRE